MRRDLGLAIDLFQPLRDVVGVSPAVFADRLRFAEAKFEVMERLGATRTLICSAVHPEASADLDLAAEQRPRSAARQRSAGSRSPTRRWRGGPASTGSGRLGGREPRRYARGRAGGRHLPPARPR